MHFSTCQAISDVHLWLYNYYFISLKHFIECLPLGDSLRIEIWIMRNFSIKKVRWFKKKKKSQIPKSPFWTLHQSILTELSRITCTVLHGWPNAAVKPSWVFTFSLTLATSGVFWSFSYASPNACHLNSTYLLTLSQIIVPRSPPTRSHLFSQPFKITCMMPRLCSLGVCVWQLVLYRHFWKDSIGSFMSHTFRCSALHIQEGH